MKYGYIRVSPLNASEEIQRKALLSEGISEENIFVEKNTKKELDKLLTILCSGDTLVIYTFLSFDVYSPVLESMLFSLMDINVTVKSIKESFDSSSIEGTYSVRLLRQLHEISVNREKEKNYLDKAEKSIRQENKNKKKERAITLYMEGAKIDSILEEVGITKPTLYTYLNEEKIRNRNAVDPESKQNIKEKVKELSAAGESITKICKVLGISKATYYNIVRSDGGKE